MKFGRKRFRSLKNCPSWEVIFDLADCEEQLKQLEADSVSPHFWDDPDCAQKKMQQIGNIKAKIAPWKDLERRLKDIAELAELIEDPESAESKELNEEIAQARSDFDNLELTTLLNQDHDDANAIVEINAGAGGTEACDWVSMLLRMYLRWAERKGFTTEIADSLEGESVGLKNVTFFVRGLNAYGFLRSENGVHRLVRISPFDANKRRHTTFASVSVLPELGETEKIEINPEDLRIDTYRASSAGGQHVNKTESAVRITHIPTGITVSCQNERSQHRNRDMALAVLQARLWEQMKAENVARINELRGDVRAIEWGNQIRSYVFQPYTLVKDHRTNIEIGDVQRVMDGDIDTFIQGYLKWSTSNKE